MPQLSIVNVVGGGSICREIDLGKLAEDIPVNEVQYNPESYSALILYYQDPKGTISLFSSGKYSLAGSKSIDDAYDVNDEFVSDIERTVNEEIPSSSFEIRYLVCTGSIDQRIDLPKAMISLGIDNTEYEPEQFPGLFYQSDSGSEFATIFGSGKIVISGTNGLEEIERFYDEIEEQLY